MPLVEDGCHGALWVMCGVPLRRPQNPSASGTLSGGGKEMWEGGSVLDDAKRHVSVPGHWPSLLTSWLEFQIWWLLFLAVWQILWSGDGVFTARECG